MVLYWAGCWHGKKCLTNVGSPKSDISWICGLKPMNNEQDQARLSPCAKIAIWPYDGLQRDNPITIFMLPYSSELYACIPNWNPQASNGVDAYFTYDSKKLVSPKKNHVIKDMIDDEIKRTSRSLCIIWCDTVARQLWIITVAKSLGVCSQRKLTPSCLYSITYLCWQEVKM